MALHTALYVLCFVLSLEASNHECIPSLPEFRDEGKHHAIDRGVQVLMTSLVIRCDGHITSWRAYVKDHKENTIHFQIWRPVSAGTYTLVGEDITTVTAAVHGSIEITLQNVIQVEHGDVVGIYQGSNRHGAIRIKTVRNTNYDMWQYDTDPPSTGATVTISTSHHDNKHQVPLIDITIVSPTNTSGTPRHSSTNGLLQTISRLSSHTVSPSNDPTSVHDANVQRLLCTTTAAVTPTNTPPSDDDDGLIFLIMIVLVMTIAILLLVVFVLGTALVLVSVKLRQVKGSASRSLPAAGSCNKSDTFVGKQVVIIEGDGCKQTAGSCSTGPCPHSDSAGPSPIHSGQAPSIPSTRSTAVHRGTVPPCPPARTIDNPSYHHGISGNTLYKTPSIESRPAQEYENPLATQQTTQSIADLYSHPRPASCSNSRRLH